MALALHHGQRHNAGDFAGTGGMASWHISSMDQYREMHARSIEDPESFWAEIAGELHWYTPWTKVLDWDVPDARWFVGATTNLCYNCVDRHVDSGLPATAPAIVWEGEPVPRRRARRRRVAELRRSCNARPRRFANALKQSWASRRATW